jgi:hypothetical protein
MPISEYSFVPFVVLLFSTLLLRPLLFQVAYLLRVRHISVLAGHGELGNEELPALQPSGAGWP